MCRCSATRSSARSLQPRSRTRLHPRHASRSRKDRRAKTRRSPEAIFSAFFAVSPVFSVRSLRLTLTQRSQSKDAAIARNNLLCVLCGLPGFFRTLTPSHAHAKIAEQRRSDRQKQSSLRSLRSPRFFPYAHSVSRSRKDRRAKTRRSPEAIFSAFFAVSRFFPYAHFVS